MLKQQCMDRHVAQVRRMRNKKEEIGGGEEWKEERERKEDEKSVGEDEDADAIIWEDHSTLYGNRELVLSTEYTLQLFI